MNRAGDDAATIKAAYSVIITSRSKIDNRRKARAGPPGGFPRLAD